MENIFTSVLNNALTASYLILAVVLFRFIFKKVPRYIICIMWGLVALKLIIPFSIESSVSLIPESTPYYTAETLEEKKPAENIETPEITPSKEADPLQGVTIPDNETQNTIPSYTPNTETKEDVSTPPVSEEIHTPSVENTEVKEEAYTPSVEVTEEREEAPIPSVENTETKTEAPALPDTTQKVKDVSLILILSIIWLSVAGLLVVWSIVSYIRLRFIMAESVKLEENVYLSDRCPTPFVMGFLKAKIYLPSDVNKEDIPYILAHERRHIKRLDHITKAISYLIFAFFWFNPLVLIAHILYSRDIELACDEAVVMEMSTDDKKAYSVALLSCSMPKHLIAACPIAFGEVGVKSRIKSVLNYKKPSFWLVIAAVVTAVVIALTLMTSPKKTAPKPTPDKLIEEKEEKEEDESGDNAEDNTDKKPENTENTLEISNPFLSVLSGERMFFLNYEKWIYICDFTFPYSGKGLSEDTSLQYTYVDFEGDGKNELVIRGLYGDMLILKANGDNCYGFTYDFRSMQTLYDDGTFAWNYTDAQGLHYGRSKLEYSDKKYKTVELCRTNQYSETGETEYYIGNKKVNSDDLIAYESNFSNKEAAFYPLNYNVPSGDYLKLSVKKDGVVYEKDLTFPEGYFPDGYEPSGYTANIVSADEFNFGEYGIMVGTATHKYAAAGCELYSYGFITDSTSDINEAESLYDRLNHSYIKEYQVVPKYFCGYDISANKDSKYYKTLGESRIVYVSQEVDRLWNLSVLDSGEWLEERQEQYNDVMGRKWTAQYDILDRNGKTISCVKGEVKDNQELAIGSFYEIPHSYYESYLDGGNYSYNTKEIFKSSHDNIQNNIKVISIHPASNRIPDEGTTLLEVSCQSNSEWDVIDYAGERYLIIGNDFTDLLYDLETGEVKKLQHYMSGATISPDGKYIAYLSPPDDAYIGANMERGFYIEELATGKTVFFTGESEMFIINWVNEEKLMKLIDRNEDDEAFPLATKLKVEVGDKEIILPAEDTQTKKVTIPFPEDFAYGYEQPSTVAPKDFNWGNYRPFVKYENGWYGELGTPVYYYAFLGENAATVEEGHALYNKLNDKYKKTFNYTLDDKLHFYPLSEEPDAMKLVNESRIIYISEDGKTVGNFYINKAENYSDENPNWSGYYELHTEKGQTAVYHTPLCINYDDGGYLNWFTSAYIPPELKTEQGSLSKYDIHINTNTLIYQHDSTINIYSLDKNRLLYRIAFDFFNTPLGKGYDLFQLLDERYLVMIIYNEYLDEKGGYCHNVYLFDLETEEMTRINGYSYNPLLSPDRKYLIYTDSPFASTPVNDITNYSYEMLSGFYVKNLETGETTFYKEGYCAPLSWVQKDALDKLLKPEEPKDEPEIPVISEQEIKFDDKVRILPAEDENTKTLVVEFPEIILGYTEPELVSPEDFEWGDYRPFVRYMIDNYGELGSTPIYSYAFLGSGIKSLTEGNALYEKLNSKYKKTFEHSEEELSLFKPYEKNAAPLTKESRVIYVSEDCSEIGNFYLEKAEPVLYDYTDEYNYNVWNGLYECYKDGKLSYSFTLPHKENGYIDYSDGGAQDYYTGWYFPHEYLMHEYEGINPVICHNDGSTEIYSIDYDNYAKDLILVYSTKDNKLKYKVAMDFKVGAIGPYKVIHQSLSERYLLISFYDFYQKLGPCNNLFLLDLETEEMTRINGYSFNHMLSPDGKYLIYTNYYEFGQGMNSPDNEDYKMGYGFYVKNLKNGETTFFKNPYENNWMTCNQPLKWVSIDGLDKAIRK